MTRSRAYLSDVSFGSFLVYPSRGKSELCARARDVTLAVKNDTRSAPNGASMVDYVVGRIRDALEANGHGRYLSPDRVLVPIPRCGLHKAGAHWPALRICQALLAAGLGHSILQCLVRETAIRSASQSGRGNRPTVREHLDSMAVRVLSGEPPERVTLIDDVISQGRQILAAAALVRGFFGMNEVVAFAVSRTRGSVAEIASVAEPCCGVVRPFFNDCHRLDNDG